MEIDPRTIEFSFLQMNLSGHSIKVTALNDSMLAQPHVAHLKALETPLTLHLHRPARLHRVALASSPWLADGLSGCTRSRAAPRCASPWKSGGCLNAGGEDTTLVAAPVKEENKVRSYCMKCVCSQMLEAD